MNIGFVAFNIVRVDHRAVILFFLPEGIESPLDTFVVSSDVGNVDQEQNFPTRSHTWRDFSENSTLHGFKYIFVRRPFWARVVWLILLMTCTGYVIYSLCNSIIKYFDFPIATIMKIKYPDDTMPFPAITLCPMTMISKRKASMRDDDPNFIKLGLNIEACEATASVRAGRPCGEALLCCCFSSDIILDVETTIDNCTEDYKNELKAVLNSNKRLFNLRDFYKAYGLDLSRMIVPETCKFGSSDKPCTYRNFTEVVTNFGKCYSFNSAPGDDVLQVSYGDLSAGLFLMLNLHTDDHQFGLLSEGIRVLVHNQGEYINPWNSALVAPGSHAQISIKRKVVSRN